MISGQAQSSAFRVAKTYCSDKVIGVRTQWEEILRLAASIRHGTVTASLMIRKLASYPRQNSLHTALREVGRIERSLFMLEWMKDPEQRRRVQVGLNKGEARNALARAVFFNRQGDLRDRSFENHRYRASGLNLSGTRYRSPERPWDRHRRRSPGPSLTHRLGARQPDR